MLIGIPRESRQGETLVAATAKTVTQLTNLGYDVIVESGPASSPTSPTARSPASVTPRCGSARPPRCGAPTSS